MSHQPTAVFAFQGDVRQSSRALRQLAVLRDLDVRTKVYTLGPPLEEPGISGALPLGDGLEVHVITSSYQHGPRWFRDVRRQLSDLLDGEEADLLIASDLFVLPALALHKRSTNSSLLFDSRELYSHLDSHENRPLVRYYWRNIERTYIYDADAVLTVSESIADRMVQRYGIVRPLVIRNIPEKQSVQRTDTLRGLLGIDHQVPIMLYQGGLRRGRGVDNVIHAAAEIKDAAFVIIGDGDQMKALTKLAKPLNNVHFLPSIPPDDLLSYTASADVGTHLMEGTCLNHRLALPNKIFEYLMAGIPIVASDLPEISKVVSDHDVGITVDPLNPQLVVEAYRTALFNDTRHAAWTSNISTVFEHYNWEMDRTLLEGTIQLLLKAT